LEQEIQRKYRGYWGEETYAELKVVRDQRKAELAKLMTAQELEEFELRNSNTANQMGWEIREFDANEQEYRALFKIKQTFEDVVGSQSPDPDDKEAQKKWSDARKAMDEEVKRAVGDERYRDYKRGTDYQYQELARLATRQGLPKDTAKKIYDMKDAAEDQANKIRRDQALTADERREALKVIQSETENGVTQLLGEKSFKTYRDRSGYWLRNVGR
jgi:hypothetical protein